MSDPKYGSVGAEMVRRMIAEMEKQEALDKKNKLKNKERRNKNAE